ncbi:hypothetical protein ANN_12419 [Periplaneta americana]|uniref:Uncharacterized protein n=1 Tax=Periplaneta americana TaxID=6978 RepID=A0ABQ8TGN2_PERAM|nr:hypothetical protein ANN_12419 [Periplaneta americana]
MGFSPDASSSPSSLTPRPRSSTSRRADPLSSGSQSGNKKWAGGGDPGRQSEEGLRREQIRNTEQSSGSGGGTEKTI